jgi:tryptophan synthase alpha subunit
LHRATPLRSRVVDGVRLATPGVEVARADEVATIDTDHIIELVRRVRRARRESKLLLVAVIVCNFAYGIASLLRGANTLAWCGILVATVAAHVTAWRLRSYRRELEQEIHVWISVARVKP